ncbi:unnamed protein product [Didymodactylos carnosus]|uniref:Uncharacterized protein n=1 Tax=Didymodactylos carnosus TaxID=1234261 RepID=A0A8S2FHP6_9BILA|nr:unnamed protein product [Didymodactylos carnosus]CAF4259944.1 unnamed protein product [Didymodactylos carnosus]
MSNSNNDGDQVQDECDDEDEISDSMQQILQMPTNMFSTPAPYRRQVTSMNRSHSPDLIFSGIHLASSKRLASENRSNPSTKRRVDHSSFPQKSSQVTTVVSSSDDDEELMNIDDKVSLRRIFHELQNTQTNLRDARSDNRDIHQQLTKLTQKMNHFSSIISVKNNQDLDRYRDSDSKEIFHDEITDEGRNLLEVSARNAGEYARNLLKILFKPHELQSKIFEGRIRFGTN